MCLHILIASTNTYWAPTMSSIALVTGNHSKEDVLRSCSQQLTVRVCVGEGKVKDGNGRRWEKTHVDKSTHPNRRDSLL